MKYNFNLKREYKKSWNYIKESKNFIYLIIGIFIVFILVGFFIPTPQSVVEQILKFIKELLEKIENSEDFKEFKQKQPESYLSSIFISDEIQFHYYNPSTNKISTFSEKKLLE